MADSRPSSGDAEHPADKSSSSPRVPHRISPPRAPAGQVPSLFSSNQTPFKVNTASTSAPSGERDSPQSESGVIPHPQISRTTSLSSDANLASPRIPPFSPDPNDRVYPIRSYVSVDPTPTPTLKRHPDNYFAGASVPGREDGPANLRRSSTLAVKDEESAQVEVVPPMARPRRPTDASDRFPDPARAPIETPAHENPFGLEFGKSGMTEDGPRSAPGSRTATDFSLRNTGHGYNILSDNDSHHSGSTTASRRSKAASRRMAPSPSHSFLKRSSAEEEDAKNPMLITARFKHVVTEQGHAIITGRDGETLQRCEDEPIHIPGAVQCFGCLIALKEEEDRLEVRIASENCERLLGLAPQELFALPSFTDMLSEEQSENLQDHIDFIRDDDMDVETNGPEVFTLSIRSKARRSRKLWCAIHVNPVHPDLIICEFELEDDSEFPLVQPNDTTPEPPEDTLDSAPTDEELKESTVASSRPLRILRSARKRKGEAAAMEVFNIMSQVQEQLAEAPDLEKFLKILVGVVKELTGFHRVMIYQFDTSYNGKVVTELVDPRATKDLYKGLHFPASDIPKQARDMYKINKVRLLYDRDHETARLVCRTMEDLERPVDLTHSYLRAMSPIHIKYLRNMAVRSSMSISINAFDELWGLISCHTYGSRGTRVSFPIRKMCRLIGDSASRNIERLSYASRLQARKLINTAPSSKNPTGYIIASSEDLLSLFDADFGLLSIHDETKILGRLEGTQEALVLLEYLRVRKYTSVLTTQDVRFDLQDLKYPPGFKVIAGLLVVPLSAGGQDFIVFFRKGQLKEVKWAGNPYEKFVREGTEGFLEPRKSFKTWSETVVGKCRDWTEEEVETAAVLCLVYGKFIEVWRQKEAALQNTQLTKLLLANSAHEVRTPLNAIINYLEIAMEGQLDTETRDNLAKSHSASKSLIYVINDLLDLTKTEAQNKLVHSEVFDLRETYQEAVEMFRGDAKRKEIALDVIEHPSMPIHVLGDQRRVRQAITNVIANAVKATNTGGVKVDVVVTEMTVDTVEVDVVIQDTGIGMTPDQLDMLFAELEQAQDQEDQPMVIDTAEGKATSKALPPARPAGTTRSILGLGLAVVARIIRNMSGQLRVKSELNQGSRFVLSFPFDLPPQDNTRPATIEGGGSQEASEKQPPATLQRASSDELEAPLWASGEAREVTLVNRDGAPGRRGSQDSDPRDSPALRRGNSLDSEKSGHSRRSYRSSMSNLSRKSLSSMNSGKSEADRLIEAMQEPHVLERPRMSNRARSSYGQLGGSSDAGYSSTVTPSAPSSPPHKELSRTRSWELEVGPKVPVHRRPQPPSEPGVRQIVGSAVPMHAIKMPDEAPGGGSDRKASTNSSVMISTASVEGDEATKLNPRLDTHTMRVLVAEDDPINSKIIQKRLAKLGHKSHLTVNGEECASKFGETPSEFDVVLMDIQMPIVDGVSSTKMIRSYEKTHPSGVILSSHACVVGRIPIIAVSASLLEADRQMYIDAGFDAWILKPISFPRLNELMRAIVEDDLREACLYRPGAWEDGGWFHKGKRGADEANTEPSGRAPHVSTAVKEAPTHPASGPKPLLDTRGSDNSGSSADTVVAAKDFATPADAP